MVKHRDGNIRDGRHAVLLILNESWCLNMIEYSTGDIFESGCDILVNPVNLDGISGKGLALEFKKRFPEHFEIYRRACLTSQFDPPCQYINPRNKGIIFLATKTHYWLPSTHDFISKGLVHLRYCLQEQPKIKTIALPSLGCGLGGLDWSSVKPLIEYNLQETFLPGRRIVVFEPK
jgi:O-acetyl-ADP-ribose deacetylase (regulator of RNase III)